jgi:hypothetical protein
MVSHRNNTAQLCSAQNSTGARQTRDFWGRDGEIIIENAESSANILH